MTALATVQLANTHARQTPRSLWLHIDTNIVRGWRQASRISCPRKARPSPGRHPRAHPRGRGRTSSEGHRGIGVTEHPDHASVAHDPEQIRSACRTPNAPRGVSFRSPSNSSPIRALYRQKPRPILKFIPAVIALQLRRHPSPLQWPCHTLEEVVPRSAALVFHILEHVSVAPEGHGRIGVAEHL
jgi:hypothetical protein